MKAYIINLKERKDKREFMKNQMNHIGMEYRVFEAYRPETIPDDIESIFSQKQSKLTPGEKACYASHLGVLKMILEEGDELALILEDDAVILDTFHKNVNEIIEAIFQNDIDRINLRHRKRACSVKKIYLPSGISLIRPWAPSLSGAAYIITKRGIEKFFSYILKSENIIPLDFEFRNAYWENEIENWEMRGAKSNIFDSDIDSINGKERRQDVKLITRSGVIKKSIKCHGLLKSAKCYPVFMMHAYRRKLRRRLRKILGKKDAA